MTAIATERPALPDVDVALVGDADLVEMMMAARRSASRMQAIELAAIAELTRRREAEEQASGVGVISARDYVTDEVAAALTVTATKADELIRFATELTGRLPATFGALADGEVDYTKAWTLWHCTAQVGDGVAAEIERRVLPRAVEQTTGEIRAKIRRLVKRLDPETLARRRTQAERSRDVQLMRTDDDTAHLNGLDLPADAATAAHNRLNAIATGLKSDGDQRGIGQLRADVFLALLSGTLTTTEPPADLTGPQAADAPGGRQEGWTGIDDAIADAIAQTIRTQLTELTGFTGLPRERSGHVRRERTGLRLLKEPEHGPFEETEPGLPGGTRPGAPGGPGPGLPGGAGPGLFDRAEQRGQLPIHSMCARLIAHAVRSQAATRSGGLPGRHVPERHRDVTELISQAGERITHALADLKIPWCTPTPDSTSQPGPNGRDVQEIPHEQQSPPGPESWHEHEDRHGHGGYRVPERMRRLLKHRDRRCVFPGCRRPVRYCDADHTIPYHRGGPTCPCNLAMLCRHHHSLKQTRGWRLQQLWPGVLLWITPTGHWRITTPADRE